MPFVDNDGKIVTAARTGDPPTEPPASPDGEDLLDRLIHMGAHGEWLALGLSDDTDDAYEGRIERVEAEDAARRGEDDVA